MQTFAVTTVPIAGAKSPRREVVRRDNEREVRAKFRKEDRVVIEIRPIEPRSARLSSKFPKLKAAFYRELSLHQESGTSLPATAESLRETFGDADRAFRARIMRVITYIESKEGVARALEHEPDLFPDEEVALIDGAFRRGSLPQVLKNLAEQLERDGEISAQIRNASWYPGVLGAGAIVVMGIFAFVVFPQLRAFYDDLQIPLIWPLTWAVGIADWLANPLHIIVALIGLGAIVGGAVAAVTSSPAVRYRLDYAAYQMPTFGELLLRRRRMRILFAMDLMLRSGESRSVIDAAFAVAEGPVFRDAMRRARDLQSTKNMRSLADAFALATPIFTKYHIGIMRTGETYGKLDDKVSAIIEEERKRIDMMIAILPKKLEATFAVGLSFVVGFIAYLMIIPTSYATAHIH